VFRSWRAAAALVAVVLAVSACADDGPRLATARADPNGQSVRVQSLDNTFRPDAVEVTAGTEVVFTNDGRNDHDVIASDGADWGVAAEMFAPGDEYRHVFTLPGEYPFYCSIHGTAEFGMIGTIVVTG
jgi:plastocyanin